MDERLEKLEEQAKQEFIDKFGEEHIQKLEIISDFYLLDFFKKINRMKPSLTVRRMLLSTICINMIDDFDILIGELHKIIDHIKDLDKQVNKL